jgi:transposase-like protein|tara:strand:+ start:414 stop:686 length:273 start_codon:yes stop_codon:yes gene_type:complete
MKISKKLIETVVLNLQVVIEEELDCPNCQKYTNVKFMYPRDYGTRFLCLHCEQDETIFFCMPEDINSLYGDEMSKVGIQLSDDGYDVVTV